jgi:hypothetical protein
MAFKSTRELLEKDTFDSKRNLEDEIQYLRAWVQDLQSGMYVNCVYCGHRYGPKDFPQSIPAAPKPDMAEALRKHIESCPKHPMSALRVRVARLEEMLVANVAAMNAFGLTVPQGIALEVAAIKEKEKP